MESRNTRRSQQPCSWLRRRLYRGHSAKLSILMLWLLPVLIAMPVWTPKVQFFMMDSDPAKLTVRLAYYLMALASLTIGMIGFREHERTPRLTRLRIPTLYWGAGALAATMPELLIPAMLPLFPAT